MTNLVLDVPSSNKFITINSAVAEPKLKDRPINFNCWASHPFMEMLVDHVRYKVQAAEQAAGLRRRRRKLRDEVHFDTLVEALVCDLAHHVLSESQGGIVAPRNLNSLFRPSRYRPFAPGKQMPKLIDVLASDDLGYVEQTKGRPGRATTIRPTIRFRNLISTYGITLEHIRAWPAEAVVLKASVLPGEEAANLEYKDTEFTLGSRRQLGALNNFLLGAEIKFTGTHDSMGNAIDPRARRLHREFTRGSFESGGRYVGGDWQRMSRADRLSMIRIFDRPVVELMFRQSALRIAHGIAAKRGVVPSHCDFDPDLLPEDLDKVAFLEDYPEGFNKLADAMLFGTSPKIWFDGADAFFPKSLPLEEAVWLVEDAYPAISPLFYTGIGHTAQFVESEVMTDVLMRLMRQGVVALPTNDSVIVARPHAAMAKAIMLGSFRTIAGVAGTVTVHGN